uniref:C-C motif chemokine n=1 Tax=Electrophorus electricus TaxID=8005 RepID=A0AAY5F699_ELEEL
MKTYCTVVIALLLFAFSSHEPNKCCFSYFKSRIPERVVKNFELTISTCKIPGVILHTNKKLEICANPTQLWVQKLMNEGQPCNCKQTVWYHVYNAHIQ